MRPSAAPRRLGSEAVGRGVAGSGRNTAIAGSRSAPVPLAHNRRARRQRKRRRVRRTAGNTGAARGTSGKGEGRRREPNRRSDESKPGGILPALVGQPQAEAFAEAGLAPGLYLVATPIGNLGDITLRALEVLRGVDRIFCEDTRVTRKLLGRYGISTPLTAYHDHNAEKVRPALLAALRRGEKVALVSDAGTPLVS